MDTQTAFHLFDEIDMAIIEAEMYLSCLGIVLEDLADTANTLPYLRPYEDALTIVMRGLRECCSKSNAATEQAFKEIKKAKTEAMAS